MSGRAENVTPQIEDLIFILALPLAGLSPDAGPVAIKRRRKVFAFTPASAGTPTSSMVVKDGAPIFLGGQFNIVRRSFSDMPSAGEADDSRFLRKIGQISADQLAKVLATSRS